MKETIITIVAALLSGLGGVLLGYWQNRRLRIREEQIDILKKLITYQFMAWEKKRTEALNLIPLAFSKSKKICHCFEDYKKIQNATTENIGNPIVFHGKLDELSDAYVKLVETIARELHYEKSIPWDKIKKPYIPRYWIDQAGIKNWY